MRKWLRVAWWAFLAVCAACLLPFYLAGKWVAEHTHRWSQAIADHVEREMQLEEGKTWPR